jgi:molybdopterin molybdotransferase
MLSVADALNLVLENAHAKLPAEIALSDAIGLVLAEDVVSDIDSPPHDKSIVDGYAVWAADLVDGRAKLEVLEEITAGTVPSCKVAPGACSRIMTGAPVPEGADAVVMIERTQFYPSPLTLLPQGERGNSGTLTSPRRVASGDPALSQRESRLGAVEIHDERFRVGQNIMRRGKSLRAGETILHSGAELGPAEIGLLAEVGRTKIQTIGPVALSIISTGNELVPAGEKPGAGQIRNSNSPLLAAATKRAGAAPNDLGIVRDKPEDLRRAIVAGLAGDILVISGGVSAGVLDLVPAVLAELGVRQVFHKINLKPGKPLWFGVHEKTANRCLVFGLPGNPVSSLVSFELFVKPAIGRIAGRHRAPPHAKETAKLTLEFVHRGDRPTYWPAMLIASPDGLLVEPRAWQGSADLRGFAGANALIAFASGDRRYQPGDMVEVLRL